MAELLASLAAVPPVVLWPRLGQSVLDVPSHNSSDAKFTPCGGGHASAAGVVVAAAVAGVADRPLTWPALGGARAFAVGGFADDRARTWTSLRLGKQVLVGLPEIVRSTSDSQSVVFATCAEPRWSERQAE